MAYQYFASAQEIRLLTIIHNSRTAVYWGKLYSDQRIICTLGHYSRETSPDYTAISYTWGRARSNQPTIIVNGEEIQVNPNCYDLLFDLRRQRRLGPFWIDAICIHQKDVTERNEQVASMGKTYRAAADTIVFLRQPQCDLSPLESGPCVLFVDPDEVILVKRDRPTALERRRKEIEQTRPFVCFRLIPETFFENPWFTRTWIVQEMLLSSEIYFMVQHTYRRISLEIVMQAYRWWAGTEYSELPAVVVMRQASIYEPRALHDSDTSLREVSRCLFRYLVKTMSFQCGDPRDKLFGICALIDAPLPGALRPEYSKSKWEIFSALTSILLVNGVPEVISLAGLAQDETATWPSWVVDWSVCTRDNRHLLGGRRSQYSAGLWRVVDEPHVHCVIQGGALMLRGILLGEVNGFGHLHLQNGGHAELSARQSLLKHGDMACVMLGLSLPLLLRRVGDILRLVDECKVDGYMKGEALAHLDPTLCYLPEPASGLLDFEIY